MNWISVKDGKAANNNSYDVWVSRVAHLSFAAEQWRVANAWLDEKNVWIECNQDRGDFEIEDEHTTVTHWMSVEGPG